MATARDIAWFAGILEGEGSFGTPTRTRRSDTVSITQKEPWILHRIASLVGGGSVKLNEQSNGRSYFRWDCYGPRARGVAMTVFTFMSPHRKEQIKRMLRGRLDYKTGPYRPRSTQNNQKVKGA